MKRSLLVAAILLTLTGRTLAQDVFNPADPIVRYSSSAAYGTAARPDTNIVGLQKWVCNITNGVSSGTGAFKTLSETYKAYFINYYNTRLSFRVKFPKSYTDSINTGKKYPVMLFMHGAGEVGCASNGGIYNNEKQLVLGGKVFAERVDANRFEGFLVYPQLRSQDAGCWGEWGGNGANNALFKTIMTFLDSMNKYAHTDIDRVFVDGLSGGGVATWRLAESFPQRIAKIAPTSAAGLIMDYPAFVHIPIWLATGGKDTNPSPAMAGYSAEKVNAIGGSIRSSLYADLGHSSWDRHWAEADFVPYMNDVHKANPLIFFNRFEFCPDSTISARLGITPGFAAYEWQKDSVTIATRINNVNTIVNGASIINYAATGNEITVRSFGSYRVRFRRVANGPWSDWSMKPAVIKSKTITATPPIEVVGVNSKTLPALNGKTNVTLQLPEGFLNYQWYRTTDNVQVANTQTFNAPVGTYKARFSEPYGCGADFSPVFKVVNASGSPKPDAAKNLSAAAMSQTTIRLDWNENPNAGTNETGFEVYRATKAGGPYTLVNITATNIVTFLDQNLTPNTKYFYVVRAIAESGAAANSNEVNVVTEVDNSAPTAPADLEYRGSTQTSIDIRWKAATDNVGINRYDIYVNGTKTFSTTNLFFTVASLDSLTSYTLTVKAVDKAGNVSPSSNQIVGFTHRQGLNYKYYHGAYNNLPNFNNLTPFKQGITDTINSGAGITDVEDNYAFLWEGRIYIPATGNYVFETNSDDGSRVYVDVPYSSGATPLVENDGAHGATVKTGSINLTKGYHTLVVSFAEVGGDALMEIYWSSNTGISRELIPRNFYSLDDNTAAAALVAPSSLIATALTHNKIGLAWSDNSVNETGFEIVRSTTATGTYVPVFTTAADATSFSDSGLAPLTTYFYKVRAVNSNSESPYAFSYTEVNWKFNGNYTDANGNASRTLGSNSNTSFNANDKQEGSHSVSVANNGYLSINGTSGVFPADGGYNQRTVALWIKPTSITNRRMIFDFGGNDNGLGLRFNSDDLIAGIASGSTRATATYSNVATASGTPWISGGWNHVAVVYNVNSLTLYLNGVQVAVNNSLAFTSINASSSSSRIANPSNTSASGSVFNDGSTWTTLQGLIDNFYVIRGALSATEIGLLKSNLFTAQSTATTLAAPSAPANPSALGAQVLSTDAIKLTWNDNSSDETGFEIWRASGDKTNNRMITVVPAGNGATVTFTDSSLFANVTYYYKVRARGPGLPSAYTAEVSGKTLNSKPVLKQVLDFTMRHSTSFSLPIHASDEDGDLLTFTTFNLPSFATLNNTSNGNANIVFNPGVSRRGSYTISVYVSDGNNGKDTTVFNLAVNDNDVPVMGAVQTSFTMQEGAQLNVPLTATDNDGTSEMIWYFDGLPSFATFVNNNNGTGSIQLRPGYSASGEYEVTAFVDDGYEAWTSRTFTLTVEEVEPDGTVQLNFRSVTGSVPLWNDIQMPALTYSTLKDTKNANSTIGIALTKGTFNASQSGTITGTNTGVYPDNILKDAMVWGFNLGNNLQDTLELRVSGLDVAKTYSFTFMADYSTNGISSSVMRFKIGNELTSVNYFQNTTQTGTIANVQPNASGQVFITMIGDPTTNRGGILNAMVIKASFDDGSAPTKPLGFTGQHVQNSGVQLKWTDRSYNETSYQVYRSLSRSGAYTNLNPGATNKDSVSYLDASVVPETQYYYYVVGANASGPGVSSDTILVSTGNNKPIINTPTSLFVKTDATESLDFSVTDDAGDVVNVTLQNKPSFLTLQDLGGSNYRIVATPNIDHLGWYNVQVKATDSKGAAEIKVINVSVSDKSVRSVFINFGNNGKTAPLPWNNWLGSKGTNATLNSLKDERNTVTPFGITMVNSWQGINDMGHMTGNNTGAYPDSVMQSGLVDAQAGARTVRFSGLNNNMKYNFVFVGSMNEGALATAEYAVGTVKDTLNAKYNTNQTANVNGLSPVGGQITVQITRLDVSQYAYLNAIAIEEYDPATLNVPLNPINLYAEPFDRNTVDLSWSDRTEDEAVVDGYLLERASDSLFTQNVTSFSLPGNTSTYRNTGLNPNTRYWYRVRAKSAAEAFSGYSNRAKTITPASIVYVNYNYTIDDAAAPWNNLFASPTYQSTFNSLKNQSGAATGISLSLTKIFNGEFTAGMNTHNNSGIVPDNVMISNYWMDNTQQAQFVVSGLNHARRYRFGFIGSSSNVGWFKGNYTGTYTINGRTVYLNSWLNSSKIVYIGDVVPDENGEVTLDYSTTAAAVYAFNCGLLIEDYTDNAPGGGTVVNAIGGSGQSYTLDADNNDDEQSLGSQARSVNGKMYPNPFTDFINMDFTNASADNTISVDVFDLSGRLVYRRNFGKMPAGSSTLRLSAAESAMTTGVYIVTLNVNGKAIQANKVIKTKN